jgi:hypothetical protein
MTLFGLMPLQRESVFVKLRERNSGLKIGGRVTRV